MTDIRCSIPDDFMRDLKRALGMHTSTDVVQEAMTILAWAVEERRRGRVILSAQRNGTDVERLAMRSLARVLPEVNITILQPAKVHPVNVEVAFSESPQSAEGPKMTHDEALAMFPGWRLPTDPPPIGKRVEVAMFAGRVSDPGHPGYPGKPWVQQGAARAVTHDLRAVFDVELFQTGGAIAWREIQS